MIDKQIYLSNANLLNNDLFDWKKININILIKETYKHINNVNYDSYISALILRLWNKIKTMKYNTSINLIENDDLYEVLLYSILGTIKLIARINDDTKPKTDNILRLKDRYDNDKSYPMKLLNIKLKRNYLSYLNYLDKDKRKTDYQGNRVELDASYKNENGDDMEGYPLPSINYTFNNNNIIDFINKSFKNKNYDIILILDSIINYDACFNNAENIKYRGANECKFKPYGLVNILQNLDDDKINNILNEYGIKTKDNDFINYCNDIKSKSMYKLKLLVDKTIAKLKCDNEFYDLLKES